MSFQSIKALLELCRATNCLIVAAFTTTGFFILAKTVTSATPWDVIMAATSMSMACAFGNVMNDYLDRDIDAKTKPKRPIPSGRITPGTVMMFSIFTAIISISLALLTSRPLQSAAFVTAVMALLLFYSAWLKRKNKFAGNILVSSIVAIPLFFPAIAFAAATTSIVIGLAGCAFFTNLSREIIKDTKEKGMEPRTLPGLIGETESRQAASILLFSAIGVSVLTAANYWTVMWEHPFKTMMLFLAYASIAASAVTLFSRRKELSGERLKIQEGAVKVGMVLAVIAYLVP